MTVNKATLAAIGLLGLLATTASAQGVAFQPVIGTFPNGVTMSVTPSVSYDHRYVRMSINPQFTQLNGFDTVSIPGAITGGGPGGGGGMGGGLVGFAGMNGPINGFESAMPPSYQGDPSAGLGAFVGGSVGSNMLPWQPDNAGTAQRIGSAPKAARLRRKPAAKAAHPATLSLKAVRGQGRP